MRHCCGGRRRVRRARAGFEIDRSERSSRAAISRAAGPDGARNTSVTTSKHAAAPPERRSRPGAGGRRQGLAGLRDDAPSHRSATMRHCCGGRRRVRRARAGFEIDRSERSSRAAISRAAGPDGARNTSVTTSSHATQTRGSPSEPPRVHATSSYSTRSRGRAFSAVAQPRPRRPGPRSGQRPCAGCRRRRPG